MGREFWTQYTTDKRNLTVDSGASEPELGQGTYHPIYQGKLTGLQGIASPSSFDMKPYLLGGLARNLEDGDWQRTTERDLGLDMKYGVTSNLTLDLTLNTDFAQVEAESGRG